MPNEMYLVTGGAGFIGSHIAEALLARGERVRVFDNLSSGRQTNLDALGGQAEFILGDVRDLAALRQAMIGVEVVFHQAAVVSVPESIADPLGALTVNVTGTQNVLIAAREAGARRVVMASSCAVYGATAMLPASEGALPDPLSPYAVHKLAGEHLARVFTSLYGLETVALRYFNVFGPRQDAASEYSAVIPRFLTALSRHEHPIVFGDGEQTRDFIYIADVVTANLLAAAAPEAVGHVINVGSGRQTSLNDLLSIAEEVTGVKCAADYRAPRPGDIRHSVGDITLAKRLLGYAPMVSFRAGVERTLDSLRATHS